MILRVAQVRRYVPTPAEELEAVLANLRSAIAAAAQRYRDGNPDGVEIVLETTKIGDDDD
jgi:hypothetical protein